MFHTKFRIDRNMSLCCTKETSRYALDSACIYPRTDTDAILVSATASRMAMVNITGSFAGTPPKTLVPMDVISKAGEINGTADGWHARRKLSGDYTFFRPSEGMHPNVVNSVPCEARYLKVRVNFDFLKNVASLLVGKNNPELSLYIPAEGDSACVVEGERGIGFVMPICDSRCYVEVDFKGKVRELLRDKRNTGGDTTKKGGDNNGDS